MWNAYDPVISNAVVLESITEARKWNGMHLYLGVPDNDTKKGWKILTPMYDFSLTESPELEYRILFRATDDDPTIAVGLKDDNDSYAMEVGIDGGFRAYGALKNQKKWDTKDRTHIQGNFRVKKGEYNVMNIKVKMPYGPNKGGTGIINEVEFMINGMTSPAKPKFDTDDLKHVARNFFYHQRIFDKVEVLEHHLRYTGISKGLKEDAHYPAFGVLTYQTLFQMVDGGYTVIRGKYVDVEEKIYGVGVMVRDHQFTSRHVLRNVHEVTDTLTFTVIVAQTVVYVKLMQDHYKYPMKRIDNLGGVSF
ncbi:hypothetical protein MTO96_017412 [Rhipicephalus appendiculatus]